MSKPEARRDKGLLVWMDLEMTGLDPERDTIIEIATLITDNQLQIVAAGPELVIHQDASLFIGMDMWNKEHHTKSGLWAKVLASPISLAEAERQTLAFLKNYIEPKTSPLCGNSIWQDRRFLSRHMPLLESYLHYRLIDVSTVKELVTRWYPETWKFSKPKGAHRALDDIHESIAELRYYNEKVFIKRPDVTPAKPAT